MNLPAPLPLAEQAHCRRTAALSELLAKLAGLPDSEVRTVTQSALVHDIGKTAIPPAILGKTGPLTEEEHAIMRMHIPTAPCVPPPPWRSSTMSAWTAAATWAYAGMRSIPMRSWLRSPMSLTPCFRPAPISGRGAFGVPAITSPASPA